MNDSIFLSSSTYLANLDQLLYNLGNHEDSFETSLSKHIIDENFSVDSLLIQKDKNKSLKNDYDSGFTCDDTQATYCITFSSENTQQNIEYSEQDTSSTCSDWSLRSNFNSLEQQLKDNIRLSSNEGQNISSNPSQTAISWSKIKSNQQIETQYQTNRIASPLNLYKIFKQKPNRTISIIGSKSLPDLSFILKYSKELSQTTSSQQNTDGPRTIKSIKQYKNSSDEYLSPHLTQLKEIPITNQDDIKRCKNKAIVIDSPPNEFCLQSDKDHEVPSDTISSSLKMNDQFDSEKISILNEFLQRVVDIMELLFEIKRSDKCLYLNNEQNSQLDALLRNGFCPVIQTILEHGRKKSRPGYLWKIIEMAMNETILSSSTLRDVPEVYSEAKRSAQMTSSHWLSQFQAFIFMLLNKNELINWLYYFTRQKDVLQYYYESPDALILVSIPFTFNLFERIMTQLEKLATFTFQLTYDNESNTSMTRRGSKRPYRDSGKNLVRNAAYETFRSTLSKKFYRFFTRSKSQKRQEQDRKQ